MDNFEYGEDPAKLEKLIDGIRASVGGNMEVVDVGELEI
jgi:hypothetical protein